MKRIFLIGPLVALTTSCTTLDQSFRLGAVTGALTGVAATYAGHGAGGRNPSAEEVGLGASYDPLRAGSPLEVAQRLFSSLTWSEVKSIINRKHFRLCNEYFRTILI